jgi:uncharacterized C2H2 Zn-finger protein
VRLSRFKVERHGSEYTNARVRRPIISSEKLTPIRKHVFTDLRPYVCLSADCSTADSPFLSRHEWARHFLDHHYREWECVYDCDEIFLSSESFGRHLRRFHSHMVSNDQLEVLVAACERRSPWERQSSCPLCQDILPSYKQFTDHVGQHMEELALFTIPNDKLEALETTGDIRDGSDEDEILGVLSSSSNNSSLAQADPDPPEHSKKRPSPSKKAKGKARVARSSPESKPARSGGTLIGRRSVSDMDGKLTFLYFTSYDFI